MRRRAGLKDVAEKVGVSIGSVSSVLNNRQIERRIPIATAEAIRKAAMELGYLPNISARRLRSGSGPKHNLLLALITSFEAPIPLIHEFLAALRHETTSEGLLEANYGYSVMIEMFSAGQLSEMPGLLAGDHFNAAIVLNTTAEDDEFLSRSHLPYPAVLVNRLVPEYDCVVEENICGDRPVEVFAQIKRNHLAVLYGAPLTQSTQRRVNRFVRRGNELFGRSPTEIRAEGLSEASGYEAMKRRLLRDHKIDALYATSDALALGAYRAIREAGLRIPKDISVIGIGDYQIAPFMEPSLSCIGVNHRELARQATRKLVQRLIGKPDDELAEYVPTLELLRESTGHG